jgi:hypothetical protein
MTRLRRRTLIVAAALIAATALSIGTITTVAPHRAGDVRKEYFSPGKEALFEGGNGGEAARDGAENPAAEQVDNRAYPRAYVDDVLSSKRIV